MRFTALVVDDSMLVRHSVCRFLEERSIAVESACNGAEAIEMLKKFHPSIIITDMNMPKMTGQELILALKKSPQTARIPVVVLTSRVNSPSAWPTSADFVISKDIAIQHQLACVLAALRGRMEAEMASA